MPDLYSLVDRLHYDGQRDYTNVRGNVAYLDGTPLTRPAYMPRTQKLIALVIVIVAIVIGFAMVNTFVISRWQEAANTEQAIADNLAREPSIDTIPEMASIINLDNEAIKSKLTTDGYTLYDASSFDDSNDMLLYKLPSDMTTGDAAALYQQGIGSLNAEQASKLLNGSWSLAVDRINGTSMVVRYADFTTSDPLVAVQNAMKKEKLDAETATDNGIDESGNTYTSGTLDLEGVLCTWKVSALPLDEMYSISGLPSDACYVGVRFTV